MQKQGQTVHKLQISIFWDPHNYLGPPGFFGTHGTYLGPPKLFGITRTNLGPPRLFGTPGCIWEVFYISNSQG